MPCYSKTCNPNAGNKVEDILATLASDQVKQRMKDFILDNATLKKEMVLYLQNIERGLKKTTHPSAVIKCFPTFVQDLPNRTEEGKFFALDLGGTNFRVLLIELKDGQCDMKSEVYAIPQEIMVGSGVPLFDHIAKCLAEFAKQHGVNNDNLPLGFTFSFPITQSGLSSGTLRRWTKRFKCDDVVGQDVVQWLSDAIKRRNDVQIDIYAIVNDTTGTLMACAWRNPHCRIGYIVGTGSNACYVETQANAEMFNESDMGSGKVIINLEMGAFGEDGAIDFLLTDCDKILDENSLNRGQQIHEKCVAGMYLGELVRLRALSLIKDGLLFGAEDARAFETKDVFTSEMISEIEAEPAESTGKTKSILNGLGVRSPSEQDMINFRYICQTVLRRAAHLIAASICVLIKKIGDPYACNEKMKELIDPGFKFDLMLSEDGSGRGAALVAAVAARKKKEMKV